jgi:hypothetical protein
MCVVRGPLPFRISTSNAPLWVMTLLDVALPPPENAPSRTPKGFTHMPPGGICGCGWEDGMAGYIDGKDALLNRLRRIEGQVRGLERMVESEAYCIDILLRSPPRPGDCRWWRWSCWMTTWRTA